jgi:2-polyprenyl-3-methyl-5-hydroxy-6-metoxy-1,4-benzoquinol methylase
MATRFSVYPKILADLRTPMRSGAVVMDFGCGDGHMVKHAIQMGFDAYGCDLPMDMGVEVKDAAILAEMKASGRHREISLNPYRLPFEDQSIDVVVSDQVLEHVRNYAETLVELRRVMKPGAVFLHAFPSRYMLIEPHVYVPGGTVIRAHWWLMLWALIGIRNGFQRGLGASEVAARNAKYLHNCTNYLRPAELKQQFDAQFSDVKFVERLFLPYSERARFLHVLGLGAVYGLFWSRWVYGRVGIPRTVADRYATHGS